MHSAFPYTPDNAPLGGELSARLPVPDLSRDSSKLASVAVGYKRIRQ